MICGATPTVQSHLFPRALVHRIRGTEKNVTEGDRSKPGIRFTQSGPSDNGFLCDRHEKTFAKADDYIARFCRKFEKAAELSPTGNSYTAPNPRPDLLLTFAAATVWRHVASKHGVTHALDLGPYRAIIERHLFDGAPLPLEVIVGRSNLVDPEGKRLEFGIAPYRQRLRNWNVWHFSIGGFDFYLKTDQKPFPPTWKQFLANDNDPITIPLIDAQPLHEVPMLQPILRRMLAR